MNEFKTNMIVLTAIALLRALHLSMPGIFSIIGYALLALLALLVIRISIAVLQSWIQEKENKKFLKTSNGTYFLWYGSNKRLKRFIKDDLEPLLDLEYEQIYHTREKVYTELSDTNYRFLFQRANTVKFPRLIKIVNGKVVTRSFYEEVNKLKRGSIDRGAFKTEVLIKLNKLKNE